MDTYPKERAAIQAIKERIEAATEEIDELKKDIATYDEPDAVLSAEERNEVLGLHQQRSVLE